MPQMMPMIWLYMLLFTFVLLMSLVILMYYLFIPTAPSTTINFVSHNYKLGNLMWFWKW